MSKLLVIIITGLPATGKTTLGKKIATELNLPFISKDEIKELLFDSLSYTDLDWSKKVGSASYDLLYYLTELFLKSKQSLIIETNFNPKFANQKLADLKNKYDFQPVQIRCFAEGQTLFERFKKRAHSQERHPGHLDAENLDALQEVLLPGTIEALDIDGPLFDLDTTDLTKLDYQKLIAELKLIQEIK
jgi:predicted kinase